MGVYVLSRRQNHAGLVSDLYELMIGLVAANRVTET